jgi:hypothetical protein
MSSQNYGRQSKSDGYSNSVPVSAECISVEAYPVEAYSTPLPPSSAAYSPPPPPLSTDVPAVNEGSNQTAKAFDNSQLNPCSLLNYSAAIKAYLSRSSWPKGLQDVFINGFNTIPTRFIICDDSGSMISNDGHRVVKDGAKAR